MYRIKVLGSSVVFSLALSLEEYNTIKLLRKDLLVLKDANGDETFRISYNAGCPDISEYGICFDKATEDELKVTALLNPSLTKEEMIKIITPVAKKLACVCEKLGADVNAVLMEQETIADSIEFLD